MSNYDGASAGRDPVKVKVIMTKFVQTDAGSFKSVVQSMTGRDSNVVGDLIGEGSWGHGAGAGSQHGHQGAGRSTAVVVPKEADRVWMDIPEWDELLRLCSQ